MENGHIPIPDGYGLMPAADLRRLSAGRILIGGSPLSILRLSEAGARTVTAWFRGEPIGASGTEQRLARRLRSNGMAHLTPPEAQAPATPEQPIGDATVVVPVKDDPDGLNATLAALCDAIPVVVVDDGSKIPVTVDRPRVRVLRSNAPTGPGRARQRALRDLTADVVVFIDAGVVLPADSLAQLLRCFEDEAVLAAAPRIVSRPDDHLVGRYDIRRSPLDLGPGPALVGPGRAVPYVPTACLAARTSALRAAGGFDPVLRYGEDVDLVWRLSDIGDVRYVPDIEAVHPPRATLAAMVTQRMSYGTAAAPLAARHGDAVSPARLSGWSALVAGLVATGHPLTAIAAGTGTGLALRPKIEPLPDATVEALLLTARGHWYGGLALLTAVARTWSPLVAAAMLLLPSQRRRMARILAAAAARRLLDGPRTPAAAGLDIALGVVDDLSYCAGVWKGAANARSAAALRPQIVSWPAPKDGRKSGPTRR